MDIHLFYFIFQSNYELLLQLQRAFGPTFFVRSIVINYAPNAIEKNIMNKCKES
jgi:hypothetical protein